MPLLHTPRLHSWTVFLGSLIGPLLLYKYATWLSYPALCVSILVFGVALGSASSFVRNASLYAAVAALAGVSVLWLPVVLVTYGFALMATPFLLAYAACVWVGIFAAKRLRRRNAPSLTP